MTLNHTFSPTLQHFLSPITPFHRLSPPPSLSLPLPPVEHAACTFTHPPTPSLPLSHPLLHPHSHPLSPHSHPHPHLHPLSHPPVEHAACTFTHPPTPSLPYHSPSHPLNHPLSHPHPHPHPLSHPPVEHAACTFTGPLEETFVRLHQLAHKADKDTNHPPHHPPHDPHHHHHHHRADKEWQASFLTDLKQALSCLTLDSRRTVSFLSRRDVRLAQVLMSDFAAAFETLAVSTTSTSTSTSGGNTSTSTSASTTASASASASASTSASGPPKKRSNLGSGPSKEPSQPTTAPSPGPSLVPSPVSVLSSSTMDDVVDKVHSWTWKLQQHLSSSNHHHDQLQPQQQQHDWSSTAALAPYAGMSHVFEFDNGTSVGVGGGVHGVSSGCALEVGSWLMCLVGCDCDCDCWL